MNTQPGDIYDANHWTKEQVANWVYSIGSSSEYHNVIKEADHMSYPHLLCATLPTDLLILQPYYCLVLITILEIFLN